MSKDRGQRSNDGEDGRRPPAVRINFARLAQGVELQQQADTESCVLICSSGKVQLNDGAIAILRLCDGSRSVDEIVAAMMRASPRETLAADILSFLEVARARGWIVSG